MGNLQFFCSESRVEDNQNIYGRFKLFPFIPGQAVTLVNGLRRCLLSEVSGIAITAIKIKGVTHEYSTIVGIRESVLDILLNVKQVVLTSEFQFEQPQVAYLRVQGPGIVRANDIKLPMSIQNVKPEQHIATLLYDGVLDIKFMICSGKNYLVQTPRGLRTPKVLKTKSPHQFNVLQSKQNMMIFSMFLNKNINKFTNKTFLNRTQFVTAPITFLKQKHKKKIKPYADLVFLREKTKKEKEELIQISKTKIPIEKVNPNTYYHIRKKQAETLQTKLVIKDVNNVFFDAVFLPIDAVFAPVLRVNFAIEENDLSNAPKECVILEIWTNGSIHPIQAIVEASKGLRNITGLLEGVTNSKPLFINSLKSFNKALTYNKIIKEEELLVKSFKKKRLGRILTETKTNLNKNIRLKEGLRFGYRSLLAKNHNQYIKAGEKDIDFLQHREIDRGRRGRRTILSTIKKLTNLKNLPKDKAFLLMKQLMFYKVPSMDLKEKKIKIKEGAEYMFDSMLNCFISNNPGMKHLIFLSDMDYKKINTKTIYTYNSVNHRLLPLFFYEKKITQADRLSEQWYNSISLGKIRRTLIEEEKIDSLIEMLKKHEKGETNSLNAVDIFYIYNCLFDKTNPTLVLKPFFKKHFSEIKNKMLRSNSNLPENIDLSVDIGNLDLSLRSYTCLKKAKIENVSDLLQKSADDLLNIKDFGKDSLNEVENSLHQLNLRQLSSF